MFIEKRNFKNSKGLTLAAIYEGEDKNSPVIVLCHGFGSGKNGVSNTDLSAKLIKIGLSVFNIDFTGCGESEGKAEDRTPLQGIDDLQAAVRNLNKDHFALYGSSYGGWVAIDFATKKPVLALGLKCPVSSWSKTYLEMRKSNDEVDDIPGLNEVENYDLYKIAKNIKCPTLIVHGSADEVVPLSQSQKLLGSLGGEKKLSIIHNGVHTMRGPTMEDAHTRLAEFFRNKLL